MAIEEKFAPLYDTWKADPSPANTGAFLRGIQPVLSAGIRSFSMEDSPIMRSHARSLAVDAFHSYDPTRSNLKTHLLHHLQGLRRISAKHQQLVNIPEQMMLDRKHILDMENKMRDELGRDPSDMEISAKTGLSLKRLGYVRSAPRASVESAYDRSAEGESAIGDPAVRTLDDDSGWSLFVYHSLHPTDQVILQDSLGLFGHKPLNNQQIAKKLGISPAAVSQRRNKIQAQLDMREDLGVL